MDNIINDVTRVTENLQQRADYAQMNADARKRIEARCLVAIKAAAKYAHEGTKLGLTIEQILAEVEIEWKESFVVIDAEELRNL